MVECRSLPQMCLLGPMPPRTPGRSDPQVPSDAGRGDSKYGRIPFVYFYREGCSSKPQPLAVEFRIGARTVAKADWPYPIVLNGHMDALTFSAPIAITDGDFEKIDSAFLPSVRAEATICLE